MTLFALVMALAAAAEPAPQAAQPPQPAAAPHAAAPMAIIAEADVERREPTPHGAIGMSTAWRISDAAPQPRTMEFRRRQLDVGAAIGIHPIAHDEVYYVLSGTGEVTSDGQTATLTAGMTAYLYSGAQVGIRQVGDAPLNMIISYPVAQHPAH